MDGISFFQRGKEAFDNREYEKAQKFFEESEEKEMNKVATVYITKCKKMIEATKNDKKSTETPTSAPNPQSSNNESQDRECLEIIKKQDYYDILKVSRDVSEEDLKRSYKKLAMKFHPDKNKSKHSPEAFKKIGLAFGVLSDKTKRDFYDRHGTEENFRQQYHQQHYDDDEVDPFDLFNIFFNGGNFQGRRVHMRRNMNHHHHQAQQQQNQPPRNFVLLQFVPIAIILLFSMVPNLLKSSPVYSFGISEVYYKRMNSQMNKIQYFVGDKFLSTYKTPKDIKELEFQIERDYLDNLAKNCNNMIRRKQELEYQLYYYGRSVYGNQIRREIEGLDFSFCEKYNELKHKIR